MTTLDTPAPPPGFEPIHREASPPPGFEPVTRSESIPPPPPGFEPISHTGTVPSPPPGFEPIQGNASPPPIPGVNYPAVTQNAMAYQRQQLGRDLTPAETQNVARGISHASPVTPREYAAGQAMEQASSNPFRAAIQGAKSALAAPLAAFSPETYELSQQEQAVDHPVANSAVNRVAGAVGGLLPAAAALTTGNPLPAIGLTSAQAGASGAGQARVEAQQQRDLGNIVGSGHEAAASVGYGILDAVSQMVAGKLFGLAGAESANIGTRLAANVGGNAALGAGVQAGQNVIAGQTIDPQRPLAQGIGGAAASGALQGAVFGAGGELLRAAARSGPPQSPLKPPAPVHPETGEPVVQQETGRTAEQARQSLPAGDATPSAPDIAESATAAAYERAARAAPRPTADAEGRQYNDQVNHALDQQAENEIAQQALERFKRGRIGEPAGPEDVYDVKDEPRPPQRVSRMEAQRGEGSGDSNEERSVANGPGQPAAPPDARIQLDESAPVPPLADRVSSVVPSERQPLGDQPGNVDALKIPADGGMATPVRDLSGPLGQSVQAAKQPQQPTTPRIAPDPITGGSPKQLKDIVLDFGNSLGKKIRQGRTNKGNAGEYYPGSTKTVIRFAGDLDVAAHEAAHFLDDKYDIVGSWARSQTPSPFDAELIPHFSQYGSATSTGPRSAPAYQRAEGVAEWIRAYIVNPKQALADAPNFARHFLSTIDDKALRTLQDFSDDVRRFKGLSDPDRVLSNINTSQSKSPGILQSVKSVLSGGDETTFKLNGLDRLRTYLQDDQLGVHRAADQLIEMRKDLDVKPSQDPRLLMRNWAGSNQKFADILENGPIKFTPSNPDAPIERAPGIGGGVHWIAGEDLLRGKPPEEIQRALNLTAARMVSERVLEKAKILNDRANDLIAKLDPADRNYQRKVDAIKRNALIRINRLAGIGGGLDADPKVAAGALAQIASDPQLDSLTKELARRWRLWSDANLQYWVDAGRLSAKAAAKIRSENTQYADMHRLIDTIDQQNLPGGRRLGSVSDTVKRFKGSTQQIESPLVSMLEQTYLMTREADRNAAMDSFFNLLRSDRSMYGGDRRDLDRFGSRAKSGDRDAIKNYHNGEEEYWQLAPDLHQTVKGWGQSPSVWKPLSYIMKTVPSSFITHAPGFIWRQIIRDSLVRPLISKVKSKPWDVLKPMSEEARSGLKLGGGDQAGHFNTGSHDAYFKLINQSIRDISGQKNTVLLLPGKLLKGYSEVTQEWGDNRSRLSEYKRAYDYARAQGHTGKDAMTFAAATARGLIDYSVMGRWMRVVNPYIPFANANVQGPVRMLQAVRDDPKRFAAVFTALVLAPRLATRAWNKQYDDQEYDQLPAYQRDFALNFKMGNGNWLSIPTQYEAGVLGAGVERLLNARDGKAHAMEDYGGSLSKAVTPVGDGIISGPALGIIEDLLNKSFFFGRNIVPQAEDKLLLNERPGTKYASRLGQAGQAATTGAAGLLQKVGIGDGQGIDARKIDHLIYTTAADFGRLAMYYSSYDRPDRAGDEPRRILDGVEHVPPATSARDVQMAQSLAEGLGDSQSPLMSGLAAIRKLHAESQSPAERDALATQMRAEGTKLRKFYERYGDALEAAKRAANANGEPGKVIETAKKISDPATRQRFIDRHGGELNNATAAKGSIQQMQRIRQVMNEAYASPDLSEPDRQQVLDNAAKALKATAEQILQR